jgi:hypothetical protein
MAGSAQSAASQPRVFISYARSDGETFATGLRERLERERISLWQDRVKMEGGRDWWLQIVEALDHVEFMALVMTPAALRSEIVRKEWRYARQRGVCVYPIKAHPDLDFKSQPRWMRDVHWYDLDHEWPRFLNDLNRTYEQPRVPFMMEDLPPDFVERPREFEALISKLLDEKREEPVAITAALRGAGGYGKTTLAKALCHDERVQEAFDDGILWITLGENPSSFIGILEDLIYVLSRQRPGFTSIDAAKAHFAELLADRDILLVIDDVWNPAHLKPFLHGGKRCARLITTRDERVVPLNAQRIEVDAMQQQEAVRLLQAGLDGAGQSIRETKALQALATRLGEWPLLLTLVGSALRERIRRGQSLPDAIATINKILDKRGLTAFDEKNPQERHQAVAKALGVSLDLLKPDEFARYRELAIFPDDVDVPLETLQKLWGATGELDDIDAEDLCRYLYELSLLLNLDLARHTIRLHDVVRAYLRQEVGEAELATLHGRLLDAYKVKRWADLPQNEPYLWDYLTYHLVEVRRVDELVATLKDGLYLATKTFVRRSHAVESDLNLAVKLAPDDIILRQLKRIFARASHLLNEHKRLQETTYTIHLCLGHLQELSEVYQPLEQIIPKPFMTSWHALPNLAQPALVRVLKGHEDWVKGCAVSPDGKCVISVSSDCTVKVWDFQSGTCLTTFSLNDELYTCAFCPDGTHFVVGGLSDYLYFLRLVW